MKKFECKSCNIPCTLECGVKPTVCVDRNSPFLCEWKMVAEPAAPPKLTAEALAERGIEWPEWAECAVVASSGWGLFATTAPCLSVDKEYWMGGGICLSIVPGKWDATDWQNSKIMRPAKVDEPDENRFTLDGVEYEAVEAKGQAGFDNSCRLCEAINRCGAVPVACGTHIKRRDGREVYWRKVKKDKNPQLPDWLKLGAWAAVGNFVGKIDWMSLDASECRITCGESRFAKTSEVKPVTWRAWTRSEWCEQIGNRFQFNDGVRMLLSVIGRDGKFEVEFLGGSYCENDDILNETITQLSGLPCGVPQVDGADLEGMPCD